MQEKAFSPTTGREWARVIGSAPYLDLRSFKEPGVAVLLDG